MLGARRYDSWPPTLIPRRSQISEKAVHRAFPSQVLLLYGRHNYYSTKRESVQHTIRLSQLRLGDTRRATSDTTKFLRTLRFNLNNRRSISHHHSPQCLPTILHHHKALISPRSTPRTHITNCRPPPALVGHCQRQRTASTEACRRWRSWQRLHMRRRIRTSANATKKTQEIEIRRKHISRPAESVSTTYIGM